MVEVGRDAAFSVNAVGLDAAPFPLSFSVCDNGGTWTIDATAARAGELADVLTRTAYDTLVIVDLATNSFLDEEFRQWPASRIAAEQGVGCRVHRLGTLASGAIGLGGEFLVICRDDLHRFLAGWSPYELTFIDVPGAPGPDQLDEIALTIGTTPYDVPVLPQLPGSRLWFSGHDDSAGRSVFPVRVGSALRIPKRQPSSRNSAMLGFVSHPSRCPGPWRRLSRPSRCHKIVEGTWQRPERVGPGSR